jgi:hypothetical protein
MCNIQSPFFHFIIYRAGHTIEPNKSLAENAAGSDDDATPAHKAIASGFSAFASERLLDDIPDEDDGAGGGGGLMVSIHYPWVFRRTDFLGTVSH